TQSDQSNAQGGFEIRLLSPGAYSVQASRAGFVTQARESLDLSAGQLLTLLFALEPEAPETAEQEQAEEEQNEAAPASTAEASSSEEPANIINEDQLLGLPLNGRSYSQLATLQAGVSDSASSSASRGVGGGSLSVSGSRATSNHFLLDGTSIMNAGNQVPRSAAGVQLGSDTVFQVQVLSVGYGPEYGRSSGGVLNSITRSGTSEFHGTLFEFFRNSKLDARNFFDQGPEPPPFKRNQFGAMVSGPIRKDKTFFLFSFEAMRDRLTETQISRYPDEKARQGLLPDPNNLDANCFLPLSDRPDDCFTDVGLHPEVKPYLEFLYPAPNSVQLRAGIREHATEVYQPTDDTFATLRVDHSISERDGVFIRYSFDDATSFSPQSSSVFRQHATSRQQYLTLAESHIFSLNTVNSFRFGYTRPRESLESLSSIEIPRSLYFYPEAPKLGVLSVELFSAKKSPK
ncbi:MAG: carboxypeptidase regulatory-like domain-containing protein, partial [Nitrospirae bacterium]|nr:carboxypeptidase regulatory-like domain-containing protein [Nitrospirota bacterium]